MDRVNPNIVYVTFGGFKPDNLYVTRDGGATWKNLAGLPPAPIRVITSHPNRSNYLYVGTEVGLFASEDSGVTWSPVNEGPTNCAVDDLVWQGSSLIAATFGRGMFKADLSAANSGLP